ncbi:MAG: DNA methyltransferase [Acidimicrobiia bacterium]|nr:DNA methyltransferase [Acidimicrobiia bacterium]
MEEAALDSSYLSLGNRRTESVHEFYRYPARFSPELAASIIDAFSEPGDLVMDPFVGGGTTAVEAQRLGRRGVVADLNPIATFVTRAKTARYRQVELREAADVVERFHEALTLSRRPKGQEHWQDLGYWRNVSTSTTWRIRRTIELALDLVSTMRWRRSRLLVRCGLLRTAQWALDMREEVPAVGEFRRQLIGNLHSMIEVAQDADRSSAELRVVDRGLPELAHYPAVKAAGPPRLVLTSPPYPGVYVNYHRWKVQGRRETPAPFWVTGSRDGHGLSHYTLGARADKSLDTYFARLTSAFEGLVSIMGDESWLIQIVGFSDPTNQVPRYLAAMEALGLNEVSLSSGLRREASGSGAIFLSAVGGCRPALWATSLPTQLARSCSATERQRDLRLDAFVEGTDRVKCG